MAEPISKLDPKLFDSIQTGFIDAVEKGFDAVQTDASKIFFALVTIELVIFGLAWAIRQEEAFGALIFKVIKFGFFYAFIIYFPAFVDFLIKGFLYEAYNIASDKGAIYLFHPGKVWEIGFKAGVSMMKLSVEYGSYNYGMSLIYLILGFGLLTMFTLIAAYIILIVVLFYLSLIVVLLMLPFGVFKAMEDFFYRAAQFLFKVGVQVFTVAIILGVSFTLWKGFKLHDVSASTGLEKPLGLFFLTMVILFLLWKLPSTLSQAVGRVGGNIFDGIFGNSAPSVTVNAPAQFSGHSVSGPVGYMATPSGGNVGGHSAAVGGASIAAATTVVSGPATSASSGGSTVSGATNVTVNSTATAASLGQKEKSGGVGQASNVSISKDTLSKLQDTVKQAMNNGGDK